MDGEIATTEQQPANAEALKEATAVLRDLCEQRGTSSSAVETAANAGGWDADDADADDCGAGRADTGSTLKAVASDADVTQHISAVPVVEAAGVAAVDESSALPAIDSKPLVDAPEFGDRVRDTDKEPFWIPGAFPTLFQNETGDLHNYVAKEPDVVSWGPHIMRARGWHAQAHMTFSYWWLNMVQRYQALSAKKWFVRDNPRTTGYTMDDLSSMSVKTLAKNMIGYTANIPGTRASKAQLRREILTMVKQIEIETASGIGASLGARSKSAEKKQADVSMAGDVPSLFGTLTSQRYIWDDIIRIIAEVEGIENYASLSRSKRRELVNKYPLFVSWYCSVRLELILKTVVVPLYGASNYVAVFEWSPTGGMVHLHYILWKRGAPRFDLQAEELLEKAAALRKSGLVAGGEVQCDVKYVVDFFAEYITEYNPNKTDQGEEKTSHVAERVNEAEPHTASLSTQEMLELLRCENPHARFAYYERVVRTEHQHDFHYPDPLGPPNPSQPCAKLLKGTLNMWYCGNGYPRDLVCEPCDRSVAQDALRPDLWRVNLCRNCQVTNPHIPLASFGMQSNTDGTPVATRHQAEQYCCKYCSKYTKGKDHKCALYEVIDDMERKDAAAKERFGEDYQASQLAGKLHRVFMGEIGVEMCQAEVGHHANKCPEYLISREIKRVHLYKKALALNTSRSVKKEKAMKGNEGDEPQEEWWNEGDEPQDELQEEWWNEWDEPSHAAWCNQGDQPQEEPEAEAKRITKPSDVELYEERRLYWFWPKDTPISPHLPSKATPEEQVIAASLYDFFRLVKLRGGQQAHFQWHDPIACPIVVMSPVVKLTEGPDFPFGARWALMQYHPWTDRRHFLDKNDTEIKDFFRNWRKTEDCPWYVKHQYLQENNRRIRGGAGSTGNRSRVCPNSGALEPAEYEAKLEALVQAEDYGGAAALQQQQDIIFLNKEC